MGRMKYFTLLLVSLIVMSFLPANRLLAASSSVVISEVSMGSGTDATDEYIVWHNNSSGDVDISGWSIQYKASTGTSWSKKGTVGQGVSVPAHDDYIFATKITADATMTSGLAQAGGNLRIVDGQGEVIDQLAWGNGDAPETQAVVACNPGESLSRKMDTEDLVAQDSDNNATDFEVIGSAIVSPVEPGADELVADAAKADASIENTANVLINELLPDPVTPLSDATDEFIELYNPDGETVSLKGWSLVDKSDHKYIIGDVQLAGHSYAVFYSKDTKISLNNDGDEVRLLSPNGELIDSSPNYDKAKSGLSWGLVDGAWVWTVESTPGSLNSAAITPETEAAAIAKAKSKAKASKAKKAATKKASIKKAATSKKSPVNSNNSGLEANQNQPKLSWWTWLLIALGIGTIGYGIYEYRPEIKIFYHKLRTKLGFWRKAS